MVFYLDSIYILILLSLPMQYNILSDSFGRLIPEIQSKWTTKKEFTHMENYMCEKAPYYVGIVSTISFIFVYYKARKMRLIISIIFYCSALTWLLYFALNENNFYLLIILRSLQGIYMAGLQVAHFSYVMYFVNDCMYDFYGCLTQFAMFLGLFLLNLLSSCFTWNVVDIILFVESIVFGSLIWLVPEIHITSKEITKEYIFSKDNLRYLLTAMLLMLIQLLSGIGFLINELDRMLEGIGINLSSTIQSCIFDFVGALATLIAAFISDAIGSKYMWAVSAFGLFFGLVFYAITLKTNIRNWVGTLCVFIYFLFYGLGVGPIPWHLGSTLFSETVRLESSAIVTCENLFLPQLIDLIWNGLDDFAGKFGTVIFCSIICFFSFFAGLYFIPAEIHSDEGSINIF